MIFLEIVLVRRTRWRHFWRYVASSLFASLAVIWLDAGTVGAAPAPVPVEPHAVEHDLGRGLGYFRIHSLPFDLPTAEILRGKSCVVDVRYLRTDRDGAAAFLAWLKFRASARAP